MRPVLGCLASLAYFSLFAGVLFGALMGGHGREREWGIGIVITLIGGFAIWFGALFCYWWFVERRGADDEPD